MILCLKIVSNAQKVSGILSGGIIVVVVVHLRATHVRCVKLVCPNLDILHLSERA
jgi:hypothetical protein